MRIWDIYPAIDLRRGRVVRLVQGDAKREKRYSDHPISVALRWQEAGARWVHVVNLDGAFAQNSPENRQALEGILTSGLQVQFGGGLRDLVMLRKALDLGVSRVVIGTAAVENPALLEAALSAFGPEQVAIGIDARRGRVCTHGWQETSTVSALELAHNWTSQGGQWIIFTDVAQDGTGRGLNLQAAAEMAKATGLRVIGSGGVASLDDVRRAYQAGLSGVIIGSALYEGRIALQAALCIDTPEGRTHE